MPKTFGLKRPYASKIYRQNKRIGRVSLNSSGQWKRSKLGATIGNALLQEGMFFYESINQGGVLQVPMVVFPVWGMMVLGKISVPKDISTLQKEVNFQEVLAGLPRTDTTNLGL